jgi:predicted HTH domain antitoxin
MKLELHDSLLGGRQLSQERIRLLLAIALFQEEDLTLGQAAMLAGLPQLIFQQELGKRKIPVHYGIKELEQEVKTLGLGRNV